MLRYIGKRLLMLIPVLLGISLVIMLLVDNIPGDPAKIMLGANVTEERLEQAHEELGLNDPFPVRYVRFIYNAAQGDLGTSFMNKRPVIDELVARLPYTLILSSLSLVFAILVGIPMGIYAATHQNTWKDNTAMFFALFCVSMPNFWVALLAVRLFAVKLGWLPTQGVTIWSGWILPCIALAVGIIAIIARQTRSNLLETIRQDYITTARSKGVSEKRVIFRHGLKNAIIPVIMTVGAIFGTSLGGAIIFEIVFSIPGVGQYTLTGLNNRDYPVIQGSVLVLSIFFALVILLVDVVFAFIDPRIRSQYAGKDKKRKGS